MSFAPAELTDQRRDEMIEKAAQAMVRRRLETPAALVLEMHKPVSVIAANLVLLGTPLAAPFLTWKFCDELALFLMDRENLRRLAERIEQLAAQRQLPVARCQPSATETGDRQRTTDNSGPRGAAP